MPKKLKKEKKNKTSNKNKNKNLLNVKININSNNKKKIVKKGNEKAPPASSSPIVISHAPQPYLQQPAYNPHVLDNVVSNNYGVGINKRLDGLDGGLTRIYENMVGMKEEQRLNELSKENFLNKFEELQAEMKQQTAVQQTPTKDFENVMANITTNHRKAPEANTPYQLFANEQTPQNKSTNYGDLYESPNNFFESNPLNEEINEEAPIEEVQQKALLVKSTPLYGSSKNISGESSADENLENVNVRSLIKRFDKSDDVTAFEKPYDPRRGSRNRPVDKSKTPALSHQDAIRKLNDSYRYYKNDLTAEGFQKFAGKLINSNAIQLNDYYDWEMKKDPGWAEHTLDHHTAKAKPPKAKSKKGKRKENDEDL